MVMVDRDFAVVGKLMKFKSIFVRVYKLSLHLILSASSTHVNFHQEKVLLLRDKQAITSFIFRSSIYT